MSAAIGTIIRTETVAVKLSNDLSRGEESRGYRDERAARRRAFQSKVGSLPK
jgi:hypothetical protein